MKHMIKNTLHQKIISHKTAVIEWFQNKSKNLFFPFYSSMDIRDSGLKIVPVDANIFPAGFNNICEIDRESIPDTARDYIQKNYKKTDKIILLTEEHTKNTYYWDNVWTLKEILTPSCRTLKISVPEKT